MTLSTCFSLTFTRFLTVFFLSSIIKKVKPYHRAGRWACRSISPWINVRTTFLIGLSESIRRRREAAGEEPEEDEPEDQEEMELRDDMCVSSPFVFFTLISFVTPPGVKTRLLTAIRPTSAFSRWSRDFLSA